MNPFSGKQFFSHIEQKLGKIDKKFHGFGVKYGKLNNCLVIDASDVDTRFSGCIFTNAKNQPLYLETMIRFDKLHLDYSDDEYDD